MWFVAFIHLSVELSAFFVPHSGFIEEPHTYIRFMKVVHIACAGAKLRLRFKECSRHVCFKSTAGT